MELAGTARRFPLLVLILPCFGNVAAATGITNRKGEEAIFPCRFCCHGNWCWKLLTELLCVMISASFDFEWQRGYFLYAEGVSAYNLAVADVLFSAYSGPCDSRGIISCTQGYSQQESHIRLVMLGYVGSG
ncbi:uncharacterized protein DS421_2g45540 [Arachis hypogaea]|nr:uncharacterized protein LOC112742844 [Arachis hypogaea]QHO53169.1 uncharacterized protein DS421_2g45540 [Arachis hypogaea]